MALPVFVRAGNPVVTDRDVVASCVFLDDLSRSITKEDQERLRVSFDGFQGSPELTDHKLSPAVLAAWRPVGYA
jgi:hypothetical protein